MPKNSLDLLNSWKGIGRRNGDEDRWQGILACIWWAIWKERNSKQFEDKCIPLPKIKMNG